MLRPLQKTKFFSPGRLGQRLAATGLLVLLFWGPASGLWADSHKIRIGILAERGPEQCLKTWKPMVGYLNSRIPEMEIGVVPLAFSEIETAVEKVAVDLILTDPAYQLQGALCG